MKHQLPPLALYIHVPWCVRKCPYCDFNSHQAGEIIPEEQYVNALLLDIEHDLNTTENREITSVFIGGGTPSLLSANAYKRLFHELRQRLPFAENAEITLEANPGTFEAERFAGFREAGINRLSVGVQSFCDEHLHALGRIHDREQAIQALKSIPSAGFSNFNIDLMHGLPGQSLQQAMDDIQQALALKPTHLSWYQLTIEPNTEFHKRPPELPEDDTLWDIQEAGQSLLAQNGFRQYEVSAYASDNHQARHNLNYWQFGDYLGIGAGAHGKISGYDSDTGTLQIFRTRKTRAPKDYLAAAENIHGNAFCVAKDELLSEDLPLEFMMNALRLYDGFHPELFQQRTGLSPDVISDALKNSAEKGLLELSKNNIRPTERGKFFLNDVLKLLMD